MENFEEAVATTDANPRAAPGPGPASGDHGDAAAVPPARRGPPARPRRRTCTNFQSKGPEGGPAPGAPKILLLCPELSLSERWTRASYNDCAMIL